MKIKVISILTISVLIVSLVYSATLRHKNEVKKINPEFGKYIAGYTSGMVTRKTSIRIELTEDYLKKPSSPLLLKDTSNTVQKSDSLWLVSLPDSSLLEDIFTFEPAIKGKTVWISHRIIEFFPSEILPVNQFYNVSFNLKKVMNVPREFRNFEFQFSTYQQGLFVNVNGVTPYEDMESLEWQQLSGTLTTSDYEDTLLLKKTLTVIQNGKTLPVHLELQSEANTFSFWVDSIKRDVKESSVTLSWNGEAIQAPQMGKKEMNVPGLGDFTVSELKVIEEDDQRLEIYFSDPILFSQNLKGMITVQGVEDLTYAIEQNKVTVFLPNRLIGEKLISVTTGIKNFKGYKMNTAYSQTALFNEPKPLVRIIGNGCILPNSNGLIFPFEAISLKSVTVRVIKIFENNIHQFLQVNNLDGEDGLTRVGKVVAEEKIKLDYHKNINLKQWNKHVIDLGKLINPDPGAIYRISIKFTKEDAVCDCTEEVTEDEEEVSQNTEIEPEKDHSWTERDWHAYGFDNGYDHWYYYNDESYSACSNAYYRGKAVSKNILASDIGLIYKLDDNKLSHAFVSNLITAKPLPNASIEYYDYTKQLIASGTTDNNGMLDIQLKRKPFLMLAKYGKQRGYLKLLDGYSNSLSKFDIEGEVVQKGVKGFIYGERGVWRPGDSLYLTFIEEDKEHRLPKDHPVKFELKDPNGQVIYQTTQTKNVHGMFDFRTATSNEAMTGNYTATVKIGNRMFTQGVKVETVKPNRLKIYIAADQKENDSTARLQVKWLHGAVAKNLRALVNVTISESKTTFDNYNTYEFDSPIRHFYSNEEVIFDNPLNQNGEAIIPTKLAVGLKAPGMLRATYITKVFEEGGDFSIDRYSLPYSPFKTYVGLKIPETKNRDDRFETDQKYAFDIATVNHLGHPVTVRKLQVKIYKIQWRWWYEKEEEDLANYVSKLGTTVVKDTIVKSDEGKSKFDFKINYPEYGRYLVTVTDLEGGHQTGKIITMDWPYWSRGNRSTTENANMLNFSCDKNHYLTGEAIKLSFPSPADGMALVSIETGTKLVKKFWIATKKGETVHSFVATPDMSPNAYVHVTLLQPHASTKNDLPIRLYGIVPITVDDPLTHLSPEIKMKEVIQPESVTTITVKESNGRKMNYTLAMVDEGLLDLTRFKTPQPWNTFYAREALGVTTWDMYDAVIGAYAGKLDKLLSVGGDGDGMAGKGAKANRFKPMVVFMGPFQLEAGQEKKHTVKIPNYVGSVRVMVVAQHEGAYGTTEKAVAVRKPLMVLATLPRVLGPGETVSLPVDVFAMEKQVKDVRVTVEINDLLTLDGSKQQLMHFTQTGDEVINFKLKVAEKTGIAKVKIIAVCGKEKATQEIELDVRTPNPKVVEGSEMVLEPGKSWETEVLFKGILGTNKATLELSSIPSLGLEKRMDYLIQYPHGCIEQTTSSVFPQLYVSNLMELKDDQKNKISQHIKAGLKRLQLFQTASGGFSYWPGEGYESEWGSNYAGHFMIEAENQGYHLPANVKANWLKYQKQQALNWSGNNTMYTHPHGQETNEVIQAYRLFVLALSNHPELGAMNRLREEKNISSIAKWRLAAAYELAGQHEVALTLIQGLSVNVKPYQELSYSYGSETRDEAMILETLSLLHEKSKAVPMAKQLAKSLNTNTWMSTQETAYALLAICEFSGIKNDQGNINFVYGLNTGEAIQQSTTKTISQVSIHQRENSVKEIINIKNTGSRTLFAKLMVEGVPLTGDKTSSAKDLTMKIVYKTMKGQVIEPDKLQQGTDFIAEVTISNPGNRGFLKEMVLNQVFPSGWEIHNTRLDGTTNMHSARYQDIRDDRVYSYYELAENTSKTFIIQLNATYLGRFYLPTLYSEAMYDNLIHARIPGRWVEVVKDLDKVAAK